MRLFKKQLSKMGWMDFRDACAFVFSIYIVVLGIAIFEVMVYG